MNDVNLAPDIPRFTVLDTPLLAIDYKGMIQHLLALASSNRTLVVDFANTQIVTLRRHNRDFARLTENTDLFLPDGMPLVWAMNLLGASLDDRVYGPTFTKRFLELCPGEFSHYLVGGSADCGQRFVQNFLAANPALKFVGGYHGACSPDGILGEDDAIMAELLELKPKFVWVGLGTPKQYHWIKRARSKGIQAVFLAVGFAFDVNAGTKRDAPAWMQRSGLTWLFRLASEPARLGPRYVKYNSLFLLYLASDWFHRLDRKAQRK